MTCATRRSRRGRGPRRRLGAASSRVAARPQPSLQVPYYVGPCPVRALAGLPVVDGETLRGVLAIDRTRQRPFTPHEEEIAAQAARFCLRAIQNERVFFQLERAKVEQGKLYRAAQSLGGRAQRERRPRRRREERRARSRASTSRRSPSSTKPRACTRSSQPRAPRRDRRPGRRALRAQRGARLDGRAEPLPAAVPRRVRRRSPGGPHAPLPVAEVPSLLVLPLVLHDRALGTLILGAARHHAFGEAVRPTLEVLASHLATSLSNARMIAQLEKMATTDGLTGPPEQARDARRSGPARSRPRRASAGR